MRALIFEPDHRGHHLQYVRLLANALAELPVSVHVALGREAAHSDERRVHLAALSSKVTVSTALGAGAGGPLQRALASLVALHRVAREQRADQVYVPYGDGLAQVAGLLPLRFPRGVEAEILLMRGGFAYPRERRRDALRDRLGPPLLALGPWTRLHFLDPLPFRAIQARGGALAARSREIPEPVEPATAPPREAARQRLGLPAEGVLFGCAGGLDSRKGIDHLLHATAAAASQLGDARLVLIGRVAPPIRALLDGPLAELQRSGRLLLEDRYVSEAELDCVFSALDLVVTPYPRHVGSSGIVVRAAAAGRPLLGSDYGWVGWSIREHGLGHTVDVTHPTAFVKALTRAVREAPDYRPGDAARAFAAWHTAEHQREAWTARLRERLAGG